METSKEKLLIAMSKGFQFEKLFGQKLSKVTEALDVSNLDVHVIQDDAQIAQRYFEKRGKEVSLIKAFSRPSLQRSLLAYNYVVVFWDGDDLTGLVHAATLLKLPVRLVPVQITKVRNRDRDQEFDVYIGRGTPWGNPFPIGKGGTGDSREEVIEKYRKHFRENILTNPEMLKGMLGLKGARLGCHCSPLPCHGDVIAGFLNTYEPDVPDEGDI